MSVLTPVRPRVLATQLIPNVPRVVGPLVTFAVLALGDYCLAFATGLSLRDRIFKARVIDIRGLPDEES